MDAAEMAARIYLMRNFRLRGQLPYELGARWLEDETVRRYSRPRGRLDSSGRFWPDRELEWRACCDDIRLPSRRWPWTLRDHCRTMRHCAALVGAEEAEVRARVRDWQRMLELAGEIARG
jgi:hypothetical protein